MIWYVIAWPPLRGPTKDPVAPCEERESKTAHGVTALIVSFSGGSREARGWWIFFGIVSLIGGVVITAVPVESVTALAVLVGIWFIVQGLFEIAGAFMLRHEASKSQTRVVSRPGEGAAAL